MTRKELSKLVYEAMGNPMPTPGFEKAIDAVCAALDEDTKKVYGEIDKRIVLANSGDMYSLGSIAGLRIAMSIYSGDTSHLRRKEGES